MELDPFTIKIGGLGTDLRSEGHVIHVSRTDQLRWMVETYTRHDRRLIGSVRLAETSWVVRDSLGQPVGAFDLWGDALHSLISLL